MEIREKNHELIDRRIAEGLAVLRKYYTVEECPTDPIISNPRIAGREHRAIRYDIKGVGNLSVMTCKETDINNLSSFVIMPYSKNLPLFSSDYVYSGENRFFLLEIYDLSVQHDEIFDSGIEAFKKFKDSLADFKDFPTRPCWYDDIRPVCYSKVPTTEQDDLSIRKFLDFLEEFVRLEQKTPALSGDALVQKWKKNKEYADNLIDQGGVSTDMFKQTLGAENTRRFFHELFFGAENYRPEGMSK